MSQREAAYRTYAPRADPRAARLLERMHQVLGTRTTGSSRQRVFALSAKGCTPGITRFAAVIDGVDHGSWRLESGEKPKVVLSVPEETKPRKVPLENLPKAIAKLDGEGHVVLADSLRIAFLLPEEAAVASGPPKATSVLEAASQAATVASVPVPWRQQLLSVPLTWPADRKPLEYQKIGAAYMVLAKMRAYLGDAPGLGKSCQTLLAMRAAPKSLPAMIVCPAAVLVNWADEIRMWAPEFTPRICTSGHLPTPGPKDILIVSWARLPNVAWQVPKLGLRTIVFDEGHLAKTAKTKRARAAKALAHRIPQVLVLSGTAIENRVLEMWHPLHLIDPRSFPDTDTLAAMASGHREVAVVGPDGKKVTHRFVGLTGPMLGGVLRRWMVRRTKTQVLPQLPKKTRIHVDIDLTKSAKAAYDRVEEEIRQYLAKDHRDRRLAWAGALYENLVASGQHHRVAIVEAVVQAGKRHFDTQNPLLKLGALRQLVGTLKVPSAVQWLLDHGTEPVVVFVEHKAVLHALVNKLGRVRTVVGVDGSVSARRRHEIVADFQAGKIDVLVATRALGIGVTLTRARRVLFVQRYWVPAQEEQAEDRVHRLTQTRGVEVYYLQAKGTVDEHVANLVAAKRRIIDATLGGETVTEVEGRARVDSDVVRSMSDNLAAAVARRMLEGEAPLTEDDLLAWLKQKRKP